MDRARRNDGIVNVQHLGGLAAGGVQRTALRFEVVVANLRLVSLLTLNKSLAGRKIVPDNDVISQLKGGEMSRNAPVSGSRDA